MIKKLKINNFKKYSKFELDDLSTINIFLGANNTGKTTLLEAIFSLSCGASMEPLYNVVLLGNRRNQVEGIHIYDIISNIDSTFTFSDDSYNASFEAIDYNNKVYRFEHKLRPSPIMGTINDHIASHNQNISFSEQYLTNSEGGKINAQNIAEWIVKDHGKVANKYMIHFPQISNFNRVQPAFQARFNDILAHRGRNSINQIYASLKRNPQLFQEFVREMRKVFPGIKTFDMIPYPNGSISPISVVKEDGQVLPIYSFGDGMQRWFYLIGILIMDKKGIQLIEEIDATFHFEAQKDLIKTLIKYTKMYQSQVFATCHNIEFVDNLLKSVAEFNHKDLDSIRIITLKENSNGEILSRTFKGEDAFYNRNEYNLELRI